MSSIKDKFFWIILILTILSMVYWIYFAIHSFNDYEQFIDLPYFTMSMYFDLHNPAIAHGLQFIAFDEHLSPDTLLLLPFYAIWQSPLTLMIIQEIIITSTAVFVYLISRDLLNSQKIAFFIALAYILNPGIHAIMIAAFHTEFFIIPFYLMVFYFFMKKNEVAFFISAILLLGVQEFAPIMAFTLGFGLLLMNYGKEYATLALWLMSLSILALFLYSYGESTLIAGYASGVYANVPSSIQIIPQFNTHLFTAFINGTVGDFQYLWVLEIFGIFVAVLSFGIAVFYKPLLSFILLGPWLFMAFVLSDIAFVEITVQYMAFSISALIVITIIILKDLKPGFSLNIAVSTMFLFSALCFIGSPYIIHQMLFWYNIKSDFLFMTNATQTEAINHLNYLINKIPANASVMTISYILPHLPAGTSISLLGSGQNNSFNASYIIVDYNSTLDLAPSVEPPANLSVYLQGKSDDYTKIMNGSAILYVRKAD